MLRPAWENKSQISSASCAESILSCDEGTGAGRAGVKPGQRGRRRSNAALPPDVSMLFCSAIAPTSGADFR
jgi:hypothetical protein